MSDSVFVLGGGRMGLVAARDLAASDLVDEVVIGDVDTSKAASFAKELDSGKLKTVKVDANNHDALVHAIQGSRVMINAVWYERNLDVMRAAIEARVHYNDLGGLFHMTRRQMELNSEAQQAGVTAVLGGGESPGITNVMVASIAERLDSVEEIRIRVGGKEESHTSSKLVFPFAVSTVFDEYSKSPVMYLNGEFKEVEPLSGEEEIVFPSPVGKNTCHYSIHSEIATLPLVFKGVRIVDFKLGVSEGIFKAIKPLVDAGLAATTPINVKGSQVTPRDFAIAYLTSRSSDEEPSRSVALRTEVSGRKDGKHLRGIAEVVGRPSEKIGVRNSTALMTGIGASIVAQLILTGAINKSGVLPPEVCVPPAQFFQELKKRGIEITTTT